VRRRGRPTKGGWTPGNTGKRQGPTIALRRRGTGAEAGRQARSERQRQQSVETSPGVVPGAEPPSGPKGMQGPTVVRQPDNPWTQWQVCPSEGGDPGVPTATWHGY
jgi:hypothetical protein